MKNKLKRGDMLVKWVDGKPERKIEVYSVDRKHAFSHGYKFKIEYEDGKPIEPDFKVSGIYSRIEFKIMDTVARVALEKKAKIAKIRTTSWESFPDQKIDQILNLIAA